MISPLYDLTKARKSLTSVFTFGSFHLHYTYIGFYLIPPLNPAVYTLLLLLLFSYLFPHTCLHLWPLFSFVETTSFWFFNRLFLTLRFYTIFYHPPSSSSPFAIKLPNSTLAFFYTHYAYKNCNLSCHYISIPRGLAQNVETDVKKPINI